MDRPSRPESREDREGGGGGGRRKASPKGQSKGRPTDGGSKQRSAPRTPSELPPPELIQDQDALRAFLDHARDEPRLAVDTEADSFFHYREKVCLIQVSSPSRDVLIDPLADLDLAPLGELLADERRTKVFHDGEFDVLVLKREYGFEFAGLFDTRVAAAALGLEGLGLAAVLKEHFGVELDKSMQRSDWSRRPLSEKQVAYARLDTHYLLELQDELEAALEEAGRTEIVEGECRRIEALDPPDRAFDPDEFVRLKGARSLDLERMALLRELFAERDAIARERDVPPFKVLSHGGLVEIARRGPKNERQLTGVRDVSPRQVKRIGRRLLAAIERGRDAGPLKQVPRLPPKDGTGGLDELQQELHERLKTTRKKLATELNTDSSLVLNRLVLVRLAQEAPTDPKALAATEGLLDWQRERFGDALLETIRTFRADADAGRIQLRSRRGRRG